MSIPDTDMVANNRRGRFFISRDMVQAEPERVARCLAGLIVLEAAPGAGNTIAYTAYGPDFLAIPETMEPPRYACFWTASGPAWRRIETA